MHPSATNYCKILNSLKDKESSARQDRDHKSGRGPFRVVRIVAKRRDNFGGLFIVFEV